MVDGQPWAGIRFDAKMFERPMATADSIIESLMRHCGDLRLAAFPEKQSEIDRPPAGEGPERLEPLAHATGTSVRTL